MAKGCLRESNMGGTKAHGLMSFCYGASLGTPFGSGLTTVYFRRAASSVKFLQNDGGPKWNMAVANRTHQPVSDRVCTFSTLREEPVAQQRRLMHKPMRLVLHTVDSAHGNHFPWFISLRFLHCTGAPPAIKRTGDSESFWPDAAQHYNKGR